jgi:predicted PurR-regulated permease PerM
LFILIIFISFRVISPYLIDVFTAMMLTYLLYPLFRLIYNRLGHPILSASIVLVVFILILVIPLLFIVGTVIMEADSTIDTLNDEEFLNFRCEEGDMFICDMYAEVKERFPFIDLDTQLNNLLDMGFSYIYQKATDFISSIPEKVVHLFVILFIMFYLLNDWKILLKTIEGILPLSARNKKILFKSLRDTAHGVIFGQLTTAMVQGLVALIGFLIIGISNPILWAILVSLVALVPYVGTALVWAPMSIFLILAGFMNKDFFSLGKGILLFIYGAFAISIIDNFIRPKLIGDKANLHPAIVLIGVFGGISFFGIIGIMLGPLVLAIMIVFVKLYTNDIAKEDKYGIDLE